MKTPTPASDLRLLVAIDADADALPALRAAAFAGGALEAECAGDRVWLFEQPLAALRFALQPSADHGETRMAVHIDRVTLTETDAAGQARGAPRWIAQCRSVEPLRSMLRGAEPGGRRFSPAAVELLRRSGVGTDLAALRWVEVAADASAGLPACWSPVGNGDAAIGKVPVGRGSSVAEPITLGSGQPLPDRPNWWLVDGPRACGALRGWRLRHQKSGQLGHAWVAQDAAGLPELRARVDAQRQLAEGGLAELIVPVGETRLDAPPCYLACHWTGLQPLPTWWASGPSLETALQAMQTLARDLAAAQALGCAHGALDDADLLVEAGGAAVRWRVDGLRGFDAVALDAAGRQDLRALAGLLFRLALGGPEQLPDPFWEARVGSAGLLSLIRGCLDPATAAPIETLQAFADALAALDLQGKGDAEAGGSARGRRWWRRAPG